MKKRAIIPITIGIAIGVVTAFALTAIMAQTTSPVRKADFALFTTQTDHEVFVNSTGIFTLSVSATNFGSSSPILHVVFADGDVVNYVVPSGQSFSFSQTAGTSPGVDTKIIIQLTGTVGETTPMVGWVSALALFGSTVSVVTV